MQIPPVIEFSGDRERGRSLLGFALTQMAVTRNLMGFQNLKQYQRRIRFDDGTEFFFKGLFDLDYISIYCPVAGGEVIEVKRDLISVDLVVYYYEYSEDPGSPAKADSSELYSIASDVDLEESAGGISTGLSLIKRGQYLEITAVHPFNEHLSLASDGTVASGDGNIAGVRSYSFIPRSVPFEEEYSILFLKSDYYNYFEGYSTYCQDPSKCNDSRFTSNLMWLKRSWLFVYLGNVRYIDSDSAPLAYLSEQAGGIATGFFIHDDETFSFFTLAERLYGPSGSVTNRSFGARVE